MNQKVYLDISIINKKHASIIYNMISPYYFTKWQDLYTSLLIGLCLYRYVYFISRVSFSIGAKYFNKQYSSVEKLAIRLLITLMTLFSGIQEDFLDRSKVIQNQGELVYWRENTHIVVGPMDKPLNFRQIIGSNFS